MTVVPLSIPGTVMRNSFRLVVPARLLQTSGAWEQDMAYHIVRWIRVDEGGVGGDGRMGGSDRERRIISNENYVVYGVVIEFVSPTTLMCCSGPTITGGKSRADRMEDL
jgi:hypothetical protein